MTARSQLLHHLLDEAADRWPDHPAVTGADVTLEYRSLSDASLRLASWLREIGIRRGDRLIIAAPGTPSVAALTYGASRAGVAFSLLHEQVRGVQLRHVLDDAKPALLVCDDPGSTAAAEQRGVHTVSTAEVTAHATDSLAPAAVPAPPEDGPLPVDAVCLIYTSGTTALPKAVVSTHQQMVFAADAIGQVIEYRPDDTIYNPLPLSFDYGLYQLFLAARAGAHVWLGTPAEVGPPLLANLVRSGATVLPAVPSVADALARLLHRPRSPRPALRLLTNTGASMPRETLAALRRKLPRLSVQLMFGLTECKRATVMPPDGDLLRPGSSGRALPGTEVFTVDEEGRRQPPGAIGEITVRGPHVMAGYWRRPEMTAQRFHRAHGLFPQLRTGDYGRVDEEGFLYFEGRRDDIYKENGFRVSATEVEAAARRIPGVSAAAVLPPGPAEHALLFVCGALSPAEALAAMREQIEEFKVPQQCVVLERMPLTPNGKTDRKALAAGIREAADART
ncbi:class I adenylate-forming enzyme family protein [Streptomyces sp. TRM 70361]|uniref:class I adenylate-forming enzyme family protein n=1 Tax=Streptomyces sp. TRM 70361 TaxID=3116553 RepID=UPI002E7BAD46|nr:class I adenylate-forming enzyme family protein [Streptomyces sp. TRM 70361]MEE1943033.1 class I adenylate-forming enzyme family protein [Streptomyces sp. TRM 70361]